MCIPRVPRLSTLNGFAFYLCKKCHYALCNQQSRINEIKRRCKEKRSSSPVRMIPNQPVTRTIQETQLTENTKCALRTFPLFIYAGFIYTRVISETLTHLSGTKTLKITSTCMHNITLSAFPSFNYHHDDSRKVITSL
jgi:hypothetical protein